VSQRRAFRLPGQNRNTHRWLVIRRLRLDRWSVNQKRVQHIWWIEGLQLPLLRRRKRSRPPGEKRELLRAEYPHHVWAIDFQFDQTMHGRSIKFLNVIYEYNRLCLAFQVGRRCRAAEVIDTVDDLLKLYPAPIHLRMDNGPDLIANALQEWCTGSGCNTACIPPGSPWENPFVKSFNSRLRDEFLNIELFSSVQEPKLLAEQH